MYNHVYVYIYIHIYNIINNQINTCVYINTYKYKYIYIYIFKYTFRHTLMSNKLTCRQPDRETDRHLYLKPIISCPDFAWHGYVFFRYPLFTAVCYEHLASNLDKLRKVLNQIAIYQPSRLGPSAFFWSAV